MRDTFCSSCALAFDLPLGVYPRACAGCGQVVYRNPIPVAVALVPVPRGLLTVQRAIEPKRGQFALPGGFVDFGEPWAAGCAREVREETGVEIDPGRVTLFAARSTPDGTRILMFGACPPLPEMPSLLPNGETLALGVWDGEGDLAFPIHTEVARDFLRGRR